MKRVLISSCAALMMLGGANTLSAESQINVFEDVAFNGEVRPRYEYAEVSNNGRDGATAITMRTKLGAGMKLFGTDALGGYFELLGVNGFGYDEYDSTLNDNTKYEIIEDAALARVTQGYVDLNLGTFTFRGGRQAVEFGDGRLIGSEEWRQMTRTHDALSVLFKPAESFALTGAYVAKIHSATASMETGSALINANFTTPDDATFDVYAYLLASMHDTYGISMSGNGGSEKVAYTYRLEYAMQQDSSMEYRNVKGKAKAQFYRFDVGIDSNGLVIGGNYEMLSGSSGTDDKTAFETPLGSNHEFNGWADVFLETPSGGLQDTSARLGFDTEKLGRLVGVYHMFESEQAMTDINGGTSKDLGSEIDVIYTKSFDALPGVTVMAKAALYKKGDVVGYAENTTHYWGQVSYKFATR